MAEGPVEAASDFGPSEADKVSRWVSELDLADKDLAPFIKDGREYIRVYRNRRGGAAPVTDTTETRRRRFALFWSNIQTISPAVYARTPQAVVTRRYRSNDPVGRIASEVLERSLNFTMDSTDFGGTMLEARDEYLLVGRGVAWARYVPTFRTVTPEGAPAAPKVDYGPEGNRPDGIIRSDATTPQGGPVQISTDPEPYEEVEWEEAVADHVNWEDFLTNPARSWQEVRWGSRRAFMTREELVKRFGPEKGNACTLDWAPKETGDAQKDQQFKKAAVYEIWDLCDKTVFWICRGYTDAPLDERPDPLKLKDFFPFPRPLTATTGPDSIIPTADFAYYKDQSDEIDQLTQRIDKLMDALRVRGFYAAGEKTDLNNLLSSETGMLIPVESWAVLQDKGGIRGLVDWFPVDQVLLVLKGCVEARQQLIADVYQLTGISDIMRGDTDPEETAKAQGIKASWGSLRVRDRQKELSRFARDCLRIMGEIIATHFSAETLAQMTDMQLPTGQEKAAAVAQYQAVQAQAAQSGQQPPPPPPILSQPSWDDVMALLKSNTLRAFRIDIETDSTIEPNDMEEKARRVEFVQAVGKYLADCLPVVQAAPSLLPVVTEGLKFLVRGFRVGREMEDVIDQALTALQQSAQSPQPGPPQDPAAQAKAQADGVKAQAAVIHAQAAQQSNQIEAQRVASDHEIGMGQVQAENLRTITDAKVAMQQTVQRASERHLTHEINGPWPAQQQ